MLNLLKLTAYLLGHIPYAVVFFIAKALGGLIFRFDNKRRGVAIENLTLAFGKEKSANEIELIAKKVFQNLAITALEFARLPWLTPANVGKLTDFEGAENLDRALAKKKGVILITAHFGNWELFALGNGLKGYDADVVARELDNPVLEEFVKWVRTRSGNRIISKNRAMRRLMRAVSDNRIAMILIDQNVALAEGVFVDFFGVSACTNKGPAMLASATGAAVVTGFIVREGMRHRLTIGPELKLSASGNKELDTVENTALFTGAVEDMIRKHPEQWFWVHRRWKTRPPK